MKMIRILREERHLSQQELADKVGLNKQAISQYERGVRFPKQQYLLALAEYFHVSVDYLINGDVVSEQAERNNSLGILEVYDHFGADAANIVTVYTQVPEEEKQQIKSLAELLAKVHSIKLQTDQEYMEESHPELFS